jgi:arginyl-tRNA synthetase
MIESIKTNLQAICQELFEASVEPEISRPEEQFGDYTTNVALQLGKQTGKNPREIAEALAEQLKARLAGLQAVTVAGPGFLNLTLTDEALISNLGKTPAQSLTGQTVVAEYSDPNPFKLLHAGHLYTTIVGNAAANILAAAGAQVHRVNFGGDVGLHVAKTMWAIMQFATGGSGDEAKASEFIHDLASSSLQERAAFMAQRYIEGNEAYEADPSAKEQIIAFNKRVYQLHADDDRDSDFARIYWLCRDWSYAYFQAFYEEIGVTPFEKYYPESVTAPLGVATVTEHIQPGIYEASNGAVVFKGELHGLHTRVFINSNGLPTYEAKDVGLLMKKWQDYQFDMSVVITGNDIVEYMKVVLKSVEQFLPELVRRSRHLTHGQVKLEGGAKMSSRKGNVLYADDVLAAAVTAAQTVNDNNTAQTAYAAIKYTFLKQRVGGDIIYNPAESVALEGNSGPYLQYAHARARSILRKADPSRHAGLPSGLHSVPLHDNGGLEPAERSLVRKLTEYPEIVDKAVAELSPHHICMYLYELAQAFNRFYEHSRVIGDERETLRLALVEQYASLLKDGLELLGIVAPEKM